MNPRHLVLVSTFAVVAAALPAQGEAPPPPAPPPPALAPASVVLEAGQTSLREIIDRAAIALGRNILLDEMELRIARDDGAVTLAAPVTIDAAHGEETLAALLVQHDFVLTEVDAELGLYEALALNGPRRRLVSSRAVVRTAAEVLAQPALQMPVMVTLRLQHTNAMVVSNALRPRMRPSATRSLSCTVGIVGHPSLLLLTGLQADVAALLLAARAADVPAAGALTLAAGEHELKDVVARAAEFLQWTIRLDPAHLRGVATKVHLQQAMHLNRHGCEEALAALLASRGLLLTASEPAADRYEVLSTLDGGAKQALDRAVARTPAEILARPALQMPVKTTYRLQHMNPLVATNSLRPFLAFQTAPDTLRLGPGDGPQEIAIVGMQSDVAMVLRLLAAGDVAAPGAK